MSLASWPERMDRAIHELKTQIKSPIQFWLLVQMLVWWSGLRFLQPFLPVQRMIRLVKPQNGRQKVSSVDVVTCLRLLDQFRFWNSHGACLPRALVNHRFLTIAGLGPELFIGFTHEGGHAWVELDGAPWLDPEVTARHYQPLFLSEPGGRTVRNRSSTIQ